MKIQQYELTQRDSMMVCWLEAGLRVGWQVKLKKIPGRWVIASAYPGVRKESEELQRSWKVGGLK